MELDLIEMCTADFGGARVELFDQTGLRRSYEVPAGFTEDIAVQGAPGFRTLDLRTLDPQQGYAAVATVMEDFGFDPFGIALIRIELNGSGALDNITYAR